MHMQHAFFSKPAEDERRRIQAANLPAEMHLFYFFSNYYGSLSSSFVLLKPLCAHIADHFHSFVIIQG